VFHTVLRRVTNLQCTAHFHSKTFTIFGKKRDSTFHCVRGVRWDEIRSGETTWHVHTIRRQDNAKEHPLAMMNSYRRTSWNWVFTGKWLDTQLLKYVAAFVWNLNFHFLAVKNSLLDPRLNRSRSLRVLMHHFLLQDCFSFFSSLM